MRAFSDAEDDTGPARLLERLTITGGSREISAKRRRGARDLLRTDATPGTEARPTVQAALAAAISQPAPQSGADSASQTAADTNPKLKI